jgi:hypothetical protein
LKGAIGAAIVNEDYFIRSLETVHYPGQSGIEDFEILCLIKYRDDHGIFDVVLDIHYALPNPI